MGPHVVHGEDVRMVQSPDRPGFLLEPAQPLRIGRHRLGQHLDRHLASEPRVLRPIHLPHPARAERREDLVGAQTGAGCQGHVRDS